MKAISTLLALALSAAPAIAQAWKDPLAGSSFPAGYVNTSTEDSTAPVVAVDLSGAPIVAWAERISASVSRVHVKHLTLSGWLPYGTEEISAVGSQLSPAIAVDPLSGFPVVVWMTDNYRIYLLRWNGSAWVALGGSTSGVGVSGTPGSSMAPSVVVDGAGNPIVAWVDIFGPLYAKRWDPVAAVWKAMGTLTSPKVANAGETYDAPSLELIGGTTPVLCWTSSMVTFNPQTYLTIWDAGTNSWTGFGGSDGGLGISNDADRYCDSESMKIDAHGRPTVAWCSWSATTNNWNPRPDVFVRRWNGTTWEELDGSGSQDGISKSASMASGGVTLGLTPGGRPLVAWSEETTSGSVYKLERWDESHQTWTGLGTSMSVDGLFSSWGHFSWPSMAVSATGDSFIAWADPASGGNDILISSWANQAPSPTSMEQWIDNGGLQQVPPGGMSWAETEFTVIVHAFDDMDDSWSVEVEAVAGATQKSQTTALSFSETQQVVLSGWSLGDQVSWRARFKDFSGKVSAWVEFGGSASGTDLYIRGDSAPTASAPLMSMGNGAPIQGGKVSTFDTVVVMATGNDAEADGYQLLLEFRPIGEAFTGTPTHQSALVASGTVASVAVQTDQAGPWRLCYAVEDIFGLRSAWAEAGGSAGADLVVWSGGSVGPAACAGSAGGSAGILLLGLLGAIAVQRR